jgi:hypothetical protein
VTNGARGVSTAIVALVIALSGAVAGCTGQSNNAIQPGTPCGPGPLWVADSSPSTTPPTASPLASSGPMYQSTSTIGSAGCVGTIHSSGYLCPSSETTDPDVQVVWDATNVIATVPTSSEPYDIQFTAPSGSPGEHRVVLRCLWDRFEPSKPLPSFTFTLTVVTISLSPDHGRPGSSDGKVAATRVHLAGGGIACRGDNTLIARWDGQTELARGSLKQPYQPYGLDFDVPTKPLPTVGRHTITLRCAGDANAPNITSVIFTVDPAGQPHIQVSPVTAHRNDTLTVTGSGLDCSAESGQHPELVALFDGQLVAQTPKAATVSSPYDTFTVKFRVPDNAKPGDHKVNVRCAGQDRPPTADLRVLIPHQLVKVNVDPPSGAPGTPLQITATGVDCSAEQPTLVVGWSDSSAANPVELGRLDSVSDEFQSYVLKNVRVPDKAVPGMFTIKLWCVWGSASAPLVTVTFQVPKPKLAVTLSPPAGKPGDALKVSVTVANCGAGPVVVQWQGQNSTLYDKAWTDPIPLTLDTVFPSEPGTHTITAHCGSSSADAAAFVPGIAVTPAEGARGVPITVKGLGMRCASVQVAWDGQQLGSATVQNYAFLATYQVPMTGEGGSHTVTATCPASDPPASTAFRVRAPEVSTNPVSGLPSKTVTVTGRYFPTSCQSYHFSLGDQPLSSTNTQPPSDDPAMGRTIIADVAVPDGTPAETTQIQLDCSDDTGTLAVAFAAFTVDRRGAGIRLWEILAALTALALLAVAIWWIRRGPPVLPDGPGGKPTDPPSPAPLVSVAVRPAPAPRGSQPWSVTLRSTRPDQAASAHGYFTDDFGTGS